MKKVLTFYEADAYNENVIRTRAFRLNRSALFFLHTQWGVFCPDGRIHSFSFIEKRFCSIKENQKSLYSN